MLMTNAEIQVGEWIRTDWGKIDKVLQIENIRATKEHLVHSTIDTYARESITKHSFDIIDLIEEGDYVNGTRVDDKTEGYIIFSDGCGDIELFASDIKTIVTKEQFESMEYKVGGEK